MKFALAFFVVAFVVVTVEGAAWYIRNATNPDHPGKCYSSDSKVAMDPDTEEYPPGICAKYLCSKDFEMSFYSCGVYGQAGPGCVKVEPDLSKKYPDCCQQFECVKDSEA